MNQRTPIDIPQVRMHYQPIVDLNTGEVVGAEALLRFVRADGSLASPTEGGLIERIEDDARALDRLSELILESVARDAIPHFDRHPRFYISVNVPPVTLGAGVIAGIMDRVGLSEYRTRLVAEITERQALTQVGRDALARARAAGIRVAVDDFGTGMSGIGQLMELEFDVLKIDRGQITPLTTSVTADRLVRALVALAGALRVRLTAEGVETRRQAQFLRAAGVDYGQGWYWSKALPIEGFVDALERGFASHQAWE